MSQSPVPGTSPPGDDTTVGTLSDEIKALRARVASARHTLRLDASALLTTPYATASLAAVAAAAASSSAAAAAARTARRLQAHQARQAAHDQRRAHRIGSGGVTAFRVRDPDPNAVDGGRVLGLRFEVLSRGRFLRPYFVLLNRPYGEAADGGQGNEENGEREDGDGELPAPAAAAAASFLRVHRHTVLPCIPLSGLAARFLPPPSPQQQEGQPRDRRCRRRTQDLAGFARALRREIVDFHNRTGLVADVRRAVGVGAGAGAGAADQQRRESGDGDRIVDVAAADAEARQIRVEWASGRTGRVVLGDGGRVESVVVFGDTGREWALEMGARTASEDADADADADADEVAAMLARMGMGGAG